MPRISRRDYEDADARFPLLHEAEPARPGLTPVYVPAIARDGPPNALDNGRITTLYELFQ